MQPPEMLTEEERLSTIEWYEGTQSPFWKARFLPWINDGLAVAVRAALDTSKPISERDKACGAVETLNRVISLADGYEQGFAELKEAEAQAVRREPERAEELVGPKAEDQWFEQEGRG